MIDRSAIPIGTIAFAVLLVSACGGDEAESGPTCGAGTLEKNKVCVPATGGTSGGDASDEDTAMPGGAGGTAGEAADGAPADSADGDDAQPLDDPCPTTPVLLNCASDCSGPSSACSTAGVTCGKNATSVSAKEHKSFPWVVRTPSHPGTDPNCQGLCSSGPAPVYGLSVDIGVPPDFVYDLRVTVGAPWRVFLSDLPEFCLAGSTAGCVIGQGTSVSVHLVTDDPNAPARNALIERVPKPATCP